MKIIISLIIIIFLVSTDPLNSQIQQTSGPIGGDVLCLLNSGNNLFAGTQAGGLFLTTNSGDSWVSVSGGIQEQEINSITAIENFIFVNTPLKVYRSSNSGSSWESLNNLAAAPKCVVSNGNYLYAASGNDIFASKNLGLTWVLYEDSIALNTGDIKTIGFLGNTLFAGHNEVHFTTDGGNVWNWAPIAGYGTHFNFIYQLPNSVIACADMGLFRSTDPANSWLRSTIYINDFLSFTHINQYLFAGHSLGGILFSTNDGTTWTIPAGFRVPGEPIHALTYNQDYIFVGAEFRVWRIPRSVLSLNQLSSSIPQRFELYQNYPNPFNPQTTIRLDITEASEVNLLLYNSLGELVKDLYGGKLEAGTFEYKVNAEDLSSGIYFYRLVSGKYSDIKKMILIK